MLHGEPTPEHIAPSRLRALPAPAAANDDDAPLNERQPPMNVEAERAVLGACLIDPDAIIAVAPLVAEEDFYRQAHRRIYHAILDLYARREPPDYLLVRAELERAGQLAAIGGDGVLVDLTLAVPTAANATYYAGLVEQTAVLRRLIRAGVQACEAAYTCGGDLDKALEQAQAAVFAVRRRRGTPFVPLERMVEHYYDRLDRITQSAVGEGLPTGFTDLDRVTGGLQAGELIVLAARPGQGKSAFALQVAVHAAQQGVAVAVCSLEMGLDQLAHRLVSGHAGVDSHRLRTGFIREPEWSAISTAIGELSECPVYFDDTAQLTIHELRAKVRELAATLGTRGQRLGLVVVDYLQLMRGTGRRERNRVEEVGEISQGLKTLARELQVPVLACAQLSRAVELRPGNRPQLSDLRESGQIEADADIVLFLYREEVYDGQTPRKGIADLLVAKHRSGPLADLELTFTPERTLFGNLSRRQGDA